VVGDQQEQLQHHSCSELLHRSRPAGAAAAPQLQRRRPVGAATAPQLQRRRPAGAATAP